jgi:DTW domain-containing protein YfiP
MNEIQIVLLTHEKELDRKTSTSNVVKDVLKERCETIVWERKNPDPRLETELMIEDTVLVYKDENGISAEEVGDIQNFILLEGTWQEARKIYNRSPYLKKYRVLCINSGFESEYTLRRNQVEAGLSTAEAVIEILTYKGENGAATALHEAFTCFQCEMKPNAGDKLRSE